MDLTINIAAEDPLGIAILERILYSEFRNIKITRILPNVEKKLYGCSPLRARINNFKQAAELGQYFVVLTDLDNKNCPYELLQEWKVFPLPECLFFRVAVREVEAWLLGDRKNLSKLLGIKLALTPPYPEQLDDPKKELLGLAKKGNKRIQEQLLPEKGALGKVGPGYNDTLCTFVEKNWDYKNASANAPSLARLLKRVQQLKYNP